VPRRGDDRRDAQIAKQGAVLVVVVATVCVDLRRLAGGSAALAADRRDRSQQRDELSDVVAVAAGQQHRKRDTAGVSDEVVLGAQPAAVYWTPAGFGPPLSARAWLESTTARTGPASRLPVVQRAGPRAGAARRRRCSSRAAAASRSCRSRSRPRWAAIPNGCR
jgi:hypothetical protein